MERDFGRMAEVTLMEENRNFALDKRREITGNITLSMSENMNGHGTVEVRLQVANLRPGDPHRYRYKLMLLGLDRGQSLHRIIGDIKANNRGQVQETFHLDFDNVDGKGNPMTCFFIFMIVAVASGNRQEPFHPVLKGDWDNKWHDYRPENESEVVSSEAEHESELPNEPAADSTSEPSLESPAENTTKYEAKSLQEQRSYNDYYNIYVQQMIDNLIKKKDRFMKTIPFNEVWIADNWRRVSTTSSESSETHGRLPIASNGAEHQMEKYGHFIFAFNDEYLLLGVPGTHSEEEQPDQGESGFVLWQPIRDSDYYGYWLMRIQRETGLIVGQ